MSKTGKLLEILNDMGDCRLSVDRLKIYEKKVDGLTACMKNSRETGVKRRLNVRVTDERGNPVLCEVRVIADTEMSAGFFTRRYMTGEDGILTAVLPTASIYMGKYTVVASKGPEYSKDVQSVEFKDDAALTETKEMTLVMKIKRLIDMKKAGYLCGDIHHHSIYSSPLYGGTDDVKETPEEIARSMRAAGLDFGALSDHHNVLNHERWLRTAREDFIPVISKEISTSNGHVIALGVDKDVIYDIPPEEMRTDERLRNEFVRVTCDIHDCGGMAQLNHPTDRSKSISWNVNFNDIIEIFDTVEVWNGSNPMAKNTTNGKAFEMWLRLIYGGILIPATTGSDTHNIYADDYNDMITAIQNDAELNTVFGKPLIYVKKWAAEYLSSGCVRTYIAVNGDDTGNIDNSVKATPETILEALKAGNANVNANIKSFITNGPLIYENVPDRKPGECGICCTCYACYTIYNRNGIKELRLYYSEKEYDIIPVNGTEYVLDMSAPEIAVKDYRVLYVVSSDTFETAIKYIGKIKR